MIHKPSLELFHLELLVNLANVAGQGFPTDPTNLHFLQLHELFEGGK